jgi:hypothetical protein
MHENPYKIIKILEKNQIGNIKNIDYVDWLIQKPC